MILSFNRSIARISVRTRIIVLAAIPVVGFLVNGIAFTAGEREVENAFRTADRASDLADVSREFRGMLIQMRVRTRDFAMRPTQELIHAFETTHDTAVRTFGVIEAAIDEPTRRKFAPLKGQLEEIAAQFDDLARHQKILGFTETEGIRDRMTKAGASVERIIHDDMSWMSENDMAAIASTVSVTVEEQNAAVSSIADGVNCASVEAQTDAQAMSRVAGASTDARSTAGDVKSLADTLSAEAENLDAEVRRFLADVQAA
jgi:methyl-accepting chemotaxis protein